MVLEQRALVTGAGRGIGRAIAEELAYEGGRVALVGRTIGQLADVEASINQTAPGRVRAFVADVRHSDAVDKAVGAATDWLGGVDMLVNNAGTRGSAGNWWEDDPVEWWECIESIVRGAYNCTRAVLPFMLSSNAGRIVTIASLTGTRASAWGDATSTAKTAVIRQVENLAAATIGTGVSAFALHPGIVRTELLEGYRRSPAVATMLDGIPEAVYCSPAVAARAVARIASGEFDAFNGRLLDATTLDDIKTKEDSLTSDSLKLRIVPVS